MANASCDLSAHSVSPSLMRSKPCLSSQCNRCSAHRSRMAIQLLEVHLAAPVTDEAIVAIVEHANRMGSPLSFVVLEHYGGAAARIPNDATAFPHRDLPWDILFLAQWTEPAETASHREWARSGEDILRPFSANAHLLSALDVEGDDVIRTAFGANLLRLEAVKEKYDGANFFRVNHNIKPGLAPA